MRHGFLRGWLARRPALCAFGIAVASIAPGQTPSKSLPNQGDTLRPSTNPPAANPPKDHGTTTGQTEFRTLNGEGNNPLRPNAGIGDIQFLRLSQPAYGDGTGSPSGANRPSARLISNIVCNQTTAMPNRAGWSAMVWGWGQFLDHDITESPTMDPVEPFPISVPAGDPYFDPSNSGTQTIPLSRSYWEPVDGVRQQFNEHTSYIDASVVYSNEEERALALRTLDGTGMLKTSTGNNLPFNTDGLENVPTTSAAFFLAGDIRANEQPALTSLHTIFVREHNFWARQIVAAHDAASTQTRSTGNHRLRFPGLAKFVGTAPLDDERIYQLARAIVGAEIQAITYREFLPVLLGRDALPPYRGYNPNEETDIRSEFSVAAYRFGHSTLSADVWRIGADGKTSPEGNLSLAASFFAVNEYLKSGPEPFLRGLAAQRAEELDSQVVSELRNFLFGPPGSGGLDLASLNIQRGRDWGLPDYNTLRKALFLRPVRTFADITRDPIVQGRLADAYTTVSLIDPWIGMLSEDHVPGAIVGETLLTLLSEQFIALRDGDRFWYQNSLPRELQETIERQRLAVIIRRNTTIGAELPDDVFRVRGQNPPPQPPPAGGPQPPPPPGATPAPQPTPPQPTPPAGTPPPTGNPQPTPPPHGTPPPAPPSNTPPPSGTPQPTPPQATPPAGSPPLSGTPQPTPPPHGTPTPAPPSSTPPPDHSTTGTTTPPPPPAGTPPPDHSTSGTLTPPAQTPPAGTPPPQTTPPSGTPPQTTPPAGTPPPQATPPTGTPPPLSTPPSGPPPQGTPPAGTPPPHH